MRSWAPGFVVRRDGAWAATIEAISAGRYVDPGRIFAPRPAAAIA